MNAVNFDDDKDTIYNILKTASDKLPIEDIVELSGMEKPVIISALRALREEGLIDKSHGFYFAVKSDDEKADTTLTATEKQKAVPFLTEIEFTVLLAFTVQPYLKSAKTLSSCLKTPEKAVRAAISILEKSRLILDCRRGIYKLSHAGLEAIQKFAPDTHIHQSLSDEIKNANSFVKTFEPTQAEVDRVKQCILEVLKKSSRLMLPKHIRRSIDFPDNVVMPALHELKKDGLVSSNKNGFYQLADRGNAGRGKCSQVLNKRVESATAAPKEPVKAFVAELLTDTDAAPVEKSDDWLEAELDQMFSPRLTDTETKCRILKSLMSRAPETQLARHLGEIVTVLQKSA